MFLQEEDYKVQIRDFELDELVDYTDNTRLKSELAAQEEMESYLRDRYNTGQIFAQTGTERNPLIVMYMIDIALYHLFSNITPRNIPQIRIDRYDAAIRWLDKVAQGRINPNLPLNNNEGGDPVGTSIFGSEPQNGHNW